MMASPKEAQARTAAACFPVEAPRTMLSHARAARSVACKMPRHARAQPPADVASRACPYDALQDASRVVTSAELCVAQPAPACASGKRRLPLSARYVADAQCAIRTAYFRYYLQPSTPLPMLFFSSHMLP